LPTKSLGIRSGKSAWVLYVDATCINYDGNLFDATLTAMVAALKNSMHWFHIAHYLSENFAARLPEASYDEELERTTCSRKSTIPLQLTKTVVSSSFGLFDSSVLLLFSSPPN
jgi:exosome complex component RRP43